jgi:tetratricopeptide (TPR) repeat protein
MFQYMFVALPLLIAAPDRPLPERESTSWVDKTVIAGANGGQLGTLNDRDELTPPHFPLVGLEFRVYAERGDFVFLKTREATSGWIAKKNVILLDHAVAHFSKQLEQNPNDIMALNHRGWAWSLKGEHAAGIKDMTEALRISQDTAFYNNRARILVKKGDLDQAITDYNHAINIDQGPQFYLPLYNRGMCWNLKKDYDKAIADFDRSLQINPKFPAGYHNRGVAWQAKGDLDKAMADYARALNIDPKYAPALADRGHAWLIKGDLAKARADLHAAILADVKHEPAFCYRGKLSVAQKAHDQAFADFAEAIRLNARCAAAYHERALLWGTLKEHAKSVADFEKAWRYDALNADRCAAYAFVLATCPNAKWRDGEKALLLAKQAVEREKGNIQAQQALAATYAEVGQFDEAVRYQERVLDDPQLKNDRDANRRLELYRKRLPYRQE